MVLEADTAEAKPTFRTREICSTPFSSSTIEAAARFSRLSAGSIFLNLAEKSKKSAEKCLALKY
jgi:hypothetical protein